MTILSAFSAAQSVQLDNQTVHISNLSAISATQSDQLDNQFTQLNNQSVQLTTHSAQLTEALYKLEGLQNSRGKLGKVCWISKDPVGFIYVQLPGQPEPYHLWDTVYWIDITSEYAGLFFRVLGGTSEPFGVTQAENSPRITNVQTTWLIQTTYSATVSPNGVWSTAVSSGVSQEGNIWGLRFIQSSGEIRPRNTAVRIWKRSQ